MKPCCTCKIPKPLVDFYKDKSTHDGHEYQCIACRKDARVVLRPIILERKRAYNKKYKERINANNRLFRDTNKEHYIEWQTNRMVTYRPKHLLNATKRSARVRDLEHTITLEDIIIPTKCPYLNAELTHQMGKGVVSTNSSIDRIDNTKGYIKGNVQVISMLANTMKSNATIEQLITFATNVLSPDKSVPTKQVDTKWAHYMCRSVKTRAKKNGILFSLSPTDMKATDNCLYLGMALTYKHGQGVVHSNVSVDRIDPFKGYTPDNIQLISRMANTMKNKATQEQLTIFAKNVLSMHSP